MKKIFLIIAALVLLPVNALALEEKADRLMESVDRESIYESLSPEVREELQNIGADEISTENINKISGHKLLESALYHLKDSFYQHIRFFVSVFTLALAELISQCLSLDGEMKKAVNFVFSLMLSLIMLSSFSQFVKESYQVIRDSIKFMYAFVPVFCSLTASGGRVASANLTGGMLLTVCELTGKLLDSFFLPFCMSFVILTISASFSSSEVLLAISKLVKNTVTGFLIFSSGALSFIISVSNHVTSASDSAFVKMSGALAGTFVPVIGSALKDAGGAFRSCMYIISASVGSFGIIAGLVIFLPSFIDLLVFKGGLVLFEAVFSAFDSKETACLISGLKSAVTLVLAFQCFVCFIMVISTAIVIHSGYGG